MGHSDGSHRSRSSLEQVHPRGRHTVPATSFDPAFRPTLSRFLLHNRPCRRASSRTYGEANRAPYPPASFVLSVAASFTLCQSRIQPITAHNRLTFDPIHQPRIGNTLPSEEASPRPVWRHASCTVGKIGPSSSKSLASASRYDPRMSISADRSLK